ncbi:MAG: hypothetical protein LBB05_04355 [Puniceicoccales bacterium]|jgi:chromosome segregation ATPase|nr:hypothetical protein [Puniceicoccales bacterium]
MDIKKMITLGLLGATGTFGIQWSYASEEIELPPKEQAELEKLYYHLQNFVDVREGQLTRMLWDFENTLEDQLNGIEDNGERKEIQTERKELCCRSQNLWGFLENQPPEFIDANIRAAIDAELQELYSRFQNLDAYLDAKFRGFIDCKEQVERTVQLIFGELNEEFNCQIDDFNNQIIHLAQEYHDLHTESEKLNQQREEFGYEERQFSYAISQLEARRETFDQVAAAEEVRLEACRRLVQDRINELSVAADRQYKALNDNPTYGTSLPPEITVY